MALLAASVHGYFAVLVVVVLHAGVKLRAGVKRSSLTRRLIASMKTSNSSMQWKGEEMTRARASMKQTVVKLRSPPDRDFMFFTTFLLLLSSPILTRSSIFSSL